MLGQIASIELNRHSSREKRSTLPPRPARFALLGVLTPEVLLGVVLFVEADAGSSRSLTAVLAFERKRESSIRANANVSVGG